MEELLKEITFCDNIKKVLVNNNKSPCSEIIKSQKCGYPNFQLPEPWNGDIINCKILFISSNPAVNHEERYPTINWDKNEIEDFFLNRFSKKRKWVENELRPILKNGNYPKKHVSFWASTRNMARTLFESNDIDAGKDYAITEIVHCKSGSEKGVDAALETCTDRYLERILKLTNAKILICLGDKAAKQIRRKYSITTKELISEFPKGKTILFLPHPNQIGKVKKLEKIFSVEKLNWLKTKLKNESCV